MMVNPVTSGRVEISNSFCPGNKTGQIAVLVSLSASLVIPEKSEVWREGLYEYTFFSPYSLEK